MIKNKVLYIVFIAILLSLSAMSGRGAVNHILYGALLVPVLSFTVTVAMFFLGTHRLRVSGFLSAENIRKGETAVYHVRVENPGRLSLFYVCAETWPNTPWLVPHGNKAVFRLPAHGEAAITLSFTAQYRGVYRVGVRSLKIYEPFGIISFKRRINLTETLTVFPGVRYSEHPEGQPTGMDMEPRAGVNPFEEDITDIAGLRSYRMSDHPKRIHWAATARRNELIVKEFERPESRNALFIVDNAVINTRKPRLAKHTEDTLIEWLVSVLFSVADGKTDITLQYSDEGYAAGITSRDFTCLYTEAAKIPFAGISTPSDVLSRFHDELYAYCHLYIFTATPDENWAETLAAYGENGPMTVICNVCADKDAARRAKKLAERCETFGVRCLVTEV